MAAICFFLMASSIGTAQGGYFGYGDEWIYDVSMGFDGMTMSGTVRYYYAGETTRTSFGEAYDVYDIQSMGSLAVSGSSAGVTLYGTTTMEESACYTTDTLGIVYYQYSESMEVHRTEGNVTETMVYTTSNVTTYSPPGGVGSQPLAASPGDSWTKTFTMHSEVTEYDGVSTSNYSADYSQTITFKFLRTETITVPAGTFKCNVVQQTDPEGVVTSWLNDKVGFEVRIVYDYNQSGTATYDLKSYWHESSGDVQKDSQFLVAGVAVAIGAAGIAVFLALRKKQRAPPTAQEQQMFSAPPPPSA